MTVLTAVVTAFLGTLALALSPVTVDGLRVPSLAGTVVCGLLVAALLARDIRTPADVRPPRRDARRARRRRVTTEPGTRRGPRPRLRARRPVRR